MSHKVKERIIAALEQMAISMGTDRDNAAKRSRILQMVQAELPEAYASLFQMPLQALSCALALEQGTLSREECLGLQARCREIALLLADEICEGDG